MYKLPCCVYGQNPNIVCIIENVKLVFLNCLIDFSRIINNLFYRFKFPFIMLCITTCVTSIFTLCDDNLFCGYNIFTKIVYTQRNDGCITCDTYDTSIITLRADITPPQRLSTLNVLIILISRHCHMPTFCWNTWTRIAFYSNFKLFVILYLMYT